MKNKDISRIDQQSRRSFGWYVRVGFQGKEHSKFFSDKKNGGKNSALLAAISWRDTTKLSLGKPNTDKYIKSVARNNTGIVGISLIEKRNLYEITWSEPNGNRKKTTVSINKRGKAAAFKKAKQIRAEKEALRLSPT